jgi:hypothetical protein
MDSKMDMDRKTMEVVLGVFGEILKQRQAIDAVEQDVAMLRRRLALVLLTLLALLLACAWSAINNQPPA